MDKNNTNEEKNHDQETPNTGVIEQIAIAQGSDASLEKPDPFDPSRYRLGQEFAASAGVERLLTTVPVRKPDRQWFVRVRPGEEWRLNAGVLVTEDDRETYLVDQSLVPELAGEVVPVILYTAINRQGVLFLWPARLPGPDGRELEWHRSAHEAAAHAEIGWVRVQANMSLGAYEISRALGDLDEPKWPEQDFAFLLRIAFKGRIIDSPDHAVLRRLRGEV